VLLEISSLDAGAKGNHLINRDNCDDISGHYTLAREEPKLSLEEIMQVASDVELLEDRLKKTMKANEKRLFALSNNTALWNPEKEPNEVVRGSFSAAGSLLNSCTLPKDKRSDTGSLTPGPTESRLDRSRTSVRFSGCPDTPMPLNRSEKGMDHSPGWPTILAPLTPQSGSSTPLPPARPNTRVSTAGVTEGVKRKYRCANLS